MSLSDLRISFVIPWYGTTIPGGAEAECRRTAEQLARAGADVEVLTTCVREFLSDWSINHHRPGTEQIQGVRVTRFPVRPRDTAAFDAVNWKLMNRLPVSPDEEQVFITENIRSDALCQHLSQDGADRSFLFIPYMFGTTYWGLQARPHQSWLIPCLHNESYAYLDIFKPVFRACLGLLLLSPAERALAQSIYGLPPERLHLTGGGVDSGVGADGERFRRRYKINAPFLLYVGRRDPAKNIPLLLDYFTRLVEQTRPGLKLVLIGTGELPPLAPGLADDIIDLGFISPQDKHDAYAAAVALCQPSLNESFSLVIMEAWLAGTPVIVHTDCAVTREHCQRSNGGLYFADFEEFRGCTEFLLSEPGTARRMGELGGEYVRANYTWDLVLGRLERALRSSDTAGRHDH